MSSEEIIFEAQSENQGNEKLRVRSAKSALHEICISYKWKPPLYECCEEVGPNHIKKFRFKVVIEIRQALNSNDLSYTELECFSAFQSKKKLAADHAAEGALWYLNHLGYFPKQTH